MKQILFALSLVIFLTGSVAVVDETSDSLNVKAFLITSDETVDMLDRMDQVPDGQKQEYRFFKGVD